MQKLVYTVTEVSFMIAKTAMCKRSLKFAHIYVSLHLNIYVDKSMFDKNPLRAVTFSWNF